MQQRNLGQGGHFNFILHFLFLMKYSHTSMFILYLYSSYVSISIPILYLDLHVPYLIRIYDKCYELKMIHVQRWYGIWGVFGWCPHLAAGLPKNELRIVGCAAAH
jgi:hypothetical protein